jgi:hypothetical protein
VNAWTERRREIMKLSKEELISKINGLEIDDNVKIELMEDVTDSMEVTPEVDNTEIERLKAENEDLRTKYKERFLKGDETKDEEKKDDEELEEKEIIDVKEI